MAYTISSWTMATIAFLFLFLIYKYSRKALNSNLPPGPWGLPFIGVLPYLGNHPERVFSKWSKTYGPIFSAKIGTNFFVVLNDFDSIHQVSTFLRFCLLVSTIYNVENILFGDEAKIYFSVAVFLNFVN